MSSLTLSGNEITDVVRAAGVQGDGRAATDSSMGIWEATTNLCTNGGFETNTTGWIINGVGTTLARVTTEQKFGIASLQIITPGSASNEGVIWNTGSVVSPSVAYTASAWVKAPVGTRLVAFIQERTGADVFIANDFGTTLVADGTWQRISVTATLQATAGRARVGVLTGSAPAQAVTFYLDGMQLENQPLATPYVETNGATASRAAARVQAPASLLDETQGWVAMRVRMGWVNTSLPNVAPIAWEWRQGTENQMSLYRVSTTNWAIDFRRNSTLTSRSVAATHAAGDYVTLIAAWTNTTISLSVNGGAFSSVARGGTVGGAALPATFEIGNRAATGLEIDSDVLWFACGTGTLTDTAAAAIHALGNTDKAPEDFIAIAAASGCTATMPMDTAAYLDEAFVISGSHLPHVRIDVDFTNDPTSSTRTWTDITAYCRDFRIERGRENELSQSTPGRLDLELDNRDRRFDPTYISSPYYPNVLPTRRVRVRARWDLVDYNLFLGYVDDWPLSWPDDGLNAIVEVSATDAFKVLNLYDLGGKSYSTQLSSARAGTVLYDAGFGTAEYSLQTGQSTMPAFGTIAVGSYALAHLQEVTQSEHGVLFVNGGGTIIFQDRHYRSISETSAAGTLGDSAGEIPYVDPVVPYGDSYLWNLVSVTPSGGTAETAVDASSTARHYTRSLNISSLVTSQAEALDNANYTVGRYATAAVRVDGVTAVPAGGTALWATILGLEISKRLVFNRRPPGGGTITLSEHVERIGHDVTVGRSWTIPLRLSPAETQASWILGNAANSLLGLTIRLGY